MEESAGRWKPEDATRKAWEGRKPRVIGGRRGNGSCQAGGERGQGRDGSRLWVWQVATNTSAPPAKRLAGSDHGTFTYQWDEPGSQPASQCTGMRDERCVDGRTRPGEQLAAALASAARCQPWAVGLKFQQTRNPRLFWPKLCAAGARGGFGALN